MISDRIESLLMQIVENTKNGKLKWRPIFGIYASLQC